MKRIMIFAAAAFLGAAAHADPVTVKTPTNPSSPETASAYVAELEKAVKRVCADDAAPLVGLNFYLYRSCLKATRLEVAKKDPTGLYASRESTRGTVIAAK